LKKQHSVGDELRGVAGRAAMDATDAVGAEDVAAAARQLHKEQLGVARDCHQIIARPRAAVERGGNAFAQLQSKRCVSDVWIA
jgi:hypothetical protein